MNLETWLSAERGRQKALAAHLGLTVGRISQMADGGVPPKYMLAVRDFTKGEVTLESLVQARTAHPVPSEVTGEGHVAIDPVNEVSHA